MSRFVNLLSFFRSSDASSVAKDAFKLRHEPQLHRRRRRQKLWRSLWRRVRRGRGEPVRRRLPRPDAVFRNRNSKRGKFFGLANLEHKVCELIAVVRWSHPLAVELLERVQAQEWEIIFEKRLLCPNGFFVRISCDLKLQLSFMYVPTYYCLRE